MKAVILAAGHGTRMKPLTDELPKVMLRLNNKPLIYYQIEWLKRYGINKIAINLHHLPEKIKVYLERNEFGVEIKYSFEDKILGTAGGVKKLKNFLKNGTFLIFYGDNITNLDLNRLTVFHNKTRGIATICLHKPDKKIIRESSVVNLDGKNRILKFIEKPDKMYINYSENIYSNAGIYVMEPEILKFIPDNKFSDFGKDIFPKIISAGKKMFGFPLTDYFWREIGTLEKYENAKKELKDIKKFLF